MASEESEQKEFDRKRILDEIRRRAEEAELQRIEDEEKKSKPRDAAPAPRQEKPATLRIVPVREQRVEEIRDRLIIALDRGKVDKAEDLFQELADLNPDDPDIPEYQERIETLRETHAKRSRKAAEQKAQEDAARDREEREVREKKIGELLESADFYYQQEKYVRALESLDEALSLDPKHERVIRFRENIEKARQLAERIREEEARRKAEEASIAPPVAEKPPEPVREDRDVWGSSVPLLHTEAGFAAPVESGPVLQKAPFFDRLVERISRIRVPVRPIVTALVVLVCAAAAYYVMQSIRNAVFPPKYSLLILPPETGPDQDDYFSSGFVEESIQDFSLVKELRVLGSSTTFSLRNSPARPLQIARALGVNYYMQYSLRRAAEDVLLQVSVFDTAKTVPVFRGSFTSSLREFPAVRKTILRSIVDTMKVELDDDVQKAFAPAQEVSVAGYDAYLRGRSFLAQSTPSSVVDAIAAFEWCLQTDSTFSPAQSALGWAHILAYEFDIDTTQLRLARASRAVQNSLRRGANFAETYRVWGMAAYYRGDYQQATARLEQAVAVAPSDAAAYRRLAVAYATRGMFQEAVRAASQAVAVDPRGLKSVTTEGLIHQFRGDKDEDDYKKALSSFERGERLSGERGIYASEHNADVLVYLQHSDQAAAILQERIAQDRQSAMDYYRLGRIYQAGGKPQQVWVESFERARELVEQQLRSDPGDALSHTRLALVYKRLGRFKDAENECTTALRLAPTDPDVLYNVSRMYAVHGDKEKALDYLDKALSRRYRLEKIVDMDFYILRDDPDFFATVIRQ